MKYQFKDERINFCLNVYEQFSMGHVVLKEIFAKLPNEVLMSINNYKNCNYKSGKYKVSLVFNKCGFANYYDSFTLKVQNNKEIYSIKLFYTFFSLKFAIGEDMNKTVVFMDKKQLVKRFSAPERIFSQYAFINKSGSSFSLAYIDDVRANIEKGHSKLPAQLEQQLFKLKSEDYYKKYDANVYKEINPKSK